MTNAKSLSNLKPFTKGDPRCAIYQRKGAETKKKSNAERRKMKSDLDLLLKMSLKRGDIIDPEDVLSLEEAQDMNLSVQTAISITMIKRALLGDVQAAQYVRDTVGDKPSDKVELDQSLTIESWAKNHNVKL